MVIMDDYHWLRDGSVRCGDALFVGRYGCGNRTLTEATVLKITKSRVTVKTGLAEYTFRTSDGRDYPYHGLACYSYFILQNTQENRDKAREDRDRAAFASWVSRANVSKLPIDTIREILEIIKEDSTKKESVQEMRE
ncbi:MAG: hypothetical protein M0Q91_12725 [Methanoregula sp.]|jgi:hypothetical protein|nr:hypothetical protein [Methanoregula sp.]